MSVQDSPLFEVLAIMDKLYEPRAAPRRRGRPFVHQELPMLKASVVMVGKHIKTYSGLWRYLHQHPEVVAACGFEELPDRSTFSRRLKTLPPYAFNTSGSLGQIPARL